MLTAEGLAPADWALRCERESDTTPPRLSFVGNLVGLTGPFDTRKSEFTEVHPRDQEVVRTDDIQKLRSCVRRDEQSGFEENEQYPPKPTDYDR